jgi:hypothetical protein
VPGIKGRIYRVYLRYWTNIRSEFLTKNNEKTPVGKEMFRYSLIQSFRFFTCGQT